MKPLLILILVLSTAAIAVGIFGQRTINELKARNLVLSETASSLPDLEAESRRLSSIVVDTNRIQTLRGEIPELMHLRGTIVQNRQLAEQTTEEIEKEFGKAESLLHHALDSRDREADWIVRQRMENLRHEVAWAIMKALKSHVESHGDIPSSLEGFRSAVQKQLNSEWNRTALASDDLPTEHAAKISAGLDDFELMFVPADWDIVDKPLLVLKEKEVRLLTTGEKEKVYGVLGGFDPVIQARPEDGNFEAWEAAFPDSEK